MKKLRLLSYLSLFLLCYSCAPVYRPTAVNMPLFDTANQLQLGLYTGTNGFDLQTAYSIDNNIGLIVNGSYANANRDSTRVRQHLFGEFGIGYHKKLTKSVHFETFIGAGFGQAEATDNTNLTINSNLDLLIAEGDYLKFFLQPTIAIKKPNIEIGFAPRLSYIQFNNYMDNTNNPIENLESLFIEPVLHFGFGNENIKFNAQWGFSLPSNNEVDFTFSPFIFNVGIRVILPEIL